MTRPCPSAIFLFIGALSILTNAHARRSDNAVSGNPLSEGVFVENRGQWDHRARFLYSGNALNMWITADGVVYDIPRNINASGPREAATNNPDNSAKNTRRSGDVVRMKFEGSSFAPQVRGIKREEGYHNYFIGNDSRRWAADVPLYSEIKIEELYSGIDAVFYRDGLHPRYDLVVAPGADLADVRITFEGATGVRMTPEGDLAIATSSGELRQRGLFAYQEYGAVRRQVECRFVAHEKGSIGFEAGAYDRTRPLVVDPIITSTLIGGVFGDTPSTLAFDSQGNWIVSGRTGSQDFPITTGAYDSVNAGSAELFVAKLSSDGKHLLFATFLGGSGQDDIIRAVTDRNDDIYITGHTYSEDFATTEGALDRTYNDGDGDSYVVKMGRNGNALVYSTYLGGYGREDGEGIAVDQQGHAYVAGTARSSDFTTTPGAYNRKSSGAFVVKMSLDGDSLLYSTTIADDAWGVDMGLDTEGNVYMTGRTDNPDFPTTPSAFDRDFNGGDDGFALKLNAGGSELIYSTFIGGAHTDRPLSMALDSDGNVYLTGFSTSGNFPTTPGAYDQSYNGGDDFFVTKLDASGSEIVFSTFLGGTKGEYNQDLALDSEGNIYLTGTTSSQDFPVTSNALDATLPQFGNKGIVAKLDASGTKLLYSSLLGGTRGNTEAVFITVDAEGYAFIAGSTAEADFPVTTGAFDTVPGGGSDVFITKYLITDEVSSVERPSPDPRQADNRLQLGALAPIPAHDMLEVSFRLREPGEVRMELFSLDGERVAVPVASAIYPAGEQRESITLGNLPPGVYLLRVSSPGGGSDQRRVVVQ